MTTTITTRVVLAAVCSTVFTFDVNAQTPNAQTPGEVRPHSTELAPAPMTTQESLRMRQLVDAFVMIERAGVELVSARRLMRIDQIEEMQKQAMLNGASHARFMQVQGEQGIIIAWRFDEERALEVNARLRPDAIVFENELILPEDIDQATWQRIKNALGQNATNSEAFEPDGAKAAAAMFTLQTLRTRIAEFREAHGRMPDFDRLGWEALIVDGRISSSPINPASSCPDQSRLVSIMGATQSGLDVPRDQAAWVFNTTTGMLFAAGYDDASLLQQVREHHELIAELRNIHLDAAKDGPTWLKEFAINHEITQMRLSIANHYTTLAMLGAPNFPTLNAVRSAEGVIYPVGPNPENGSNEIQIAKWDAENPPMQGAAGWNYDPEAGKFWANSPTNIGYPE